MGVFSMMRLLSVILIVFVCGLPDVWGCFSTPSMTTTTEAPLVRSGPIEVFVDEARTELDRLTDSGDTWTIYCCTWSRGVVERTCGSNGVDCFNTCNQMEGPRTERLAIFTGSNPRAQAEQYCEEAKAEDSSSRSGGSRSGEVKSPNYPWNYQDNSDTSKTIQVSAGSMIKLTFVDFNIEAHSSCRYDYVQVLDTSGAQLIKKCGSTVPSVIMSSGNRLTVKFHSDSSVTLKGFRATWMEIGGSGGWKKKREAESNSNHTITKRQSHFACSASPAIDARPCAQRVTTVSRMRRMQCPCCYVPSVKDKVCGGSGCPFCG